MRALILIAGTALALAGCGKNDQAANSANVDESLASEQTLSNDVTAIDAVTAEDSNMAADVAFTNEDANAGGTAAEPPGTKPATSKPSAARPSTNAAAPASNSTAAATTNNTL
jgi:hypothetical protein